MKTAKEIRQENLKTLARSYTRIELATMIGYSDTNYLNQLIGGHVSFGDNAARKIEACLNLKEGWMDYEHSRCAIIQEIEKELGDVDEWETAELKSYIRHMKKRRELQEKKMAGDNRS